MNFLNMLLLVWPEELIWFWVCLVFLGLDLSKELSKILLQNNGDRQIENE